MADQCTTVFVQKSEEQPPDEPPSGGGGGDQTPPQRGGVFKFVRDNPVLVGAGVVGLGLATAGAKKSRSGTTRSGGR